MALVGLRDHLLGVSRGGDVLVASPEAYLGLGG